MLNLQLLEAGKPRKGTQRKRRKLSARQVPIILKKGKKEITSLLLLFFFIFLFLTNTEGCSAMRMRRRQSPKEGCSPCIYQMYLGSLNKKKFQHHVFFKKKKKIEKKEDACSFKYVSATHRVRRLARPAKRFELIVVIGLLFSSLQGG